MRQEGAAWRAIYQSRGGYMAIMPSLHRGAHDLVFAGPGFTHPSSRWDGHDYVGGPDVSDEAVSHGVTLPAG